RRGRYGEGCEAPRTTEARRRQGGGPGAIHRAAIGRQSRSLQPRAGGTRAVQSKLVRKGTKMMRTRWGVSMAALLLVLQSSAALAAIEYKIVTASERGTYIQIGRNLAEFVAPAADIDLEALPSAGSAENVKRLRFEPGVKFALVQSDVYQAFLDQAASGNADATAMIRPLRV